MRMPVTTIRMPDELNDSIEAQLGYHDTKSEWIRDAVREKLNRDESGSNDAQKSSEAPVG